MSVKCLKLKRRFLKWGHFALSLMRNLFQFTFTTGDILFAFNAIGMLLVSLSFFQIQRDLKCGTI